MRDANGATCSAASSLAVFDSSDSGAPDLRDHRSRRHEGTGGARNRLRPLARARRPALPRRRSFDRVGGLPRKNVAAIDPSADRWPRSTRNVRSESVSRPPGRSSSARRSSSRSRRTARRRPGYDAPKWRPTLRCEDTTLRPRSATWSWSARRSSQPASATARSKAARASRRRQRSRSTRDTGEVLDWTPDNLDPTTAPRSASAWSSQNRSGARARRRSTSAPGGSDFAGGYDLATGGPDLQDRHLRLVAGGRIVRRACCTSVVTSSGSRNSGPAVRTRTRSEHRLPPSPRLVALDPDSGRVITDGRPRGARASAASTTASGRSKPDAGALTCTSAENSRRSVAPGAAAAPTGDWGTPRPRRTTRGSPGRRPPSRR